MFKITTRFNQTIECTSSRTNLSPAAFSQRDLVHISISGVTSDQLNSETTPTILAQFDGQGQKLAYLLSSILRFLYRRPRRTAD